MTSYTSSELTTDAPGDNRSRHAAACASADDETKAAPAIAYVELGAIVPGEGILGAWYMHAKQAAPGRSASGIS